MFAEINNKILSFILSSIFTVSTAMGTLPLFILAKVDLEEISQNDIMYKNEKFAFSYDKGSFSLSVNGVTMFSDASAEYKQGERHRFFSQL